MNVSLPSFRRVLHATGPTTPAAWLRVFFAAVLILFTALAVAWALGGIKAQLRRQIGESLETVVSTARAGISVWVERIEEEISVLAQTPDVVAAIEEQLGPRSANAEAGSLRRDLERILHPILHKYEYTGFAVIVPGGTRIAASGELQAGPGADSAHILDSAGRGEVGLHLSSDEANGRPTLLAAAPVRDGANRIIAVLVLSLDPTRGLSNTLRLARPGATGETYVFDRKGRVLTGSRFRDEAAGQLSVGQGAAGQPRVRARSRSTRIRDDAMLMGMPGSPGTPIRVDVRGHADYRGVEVLGAWTWASKLDIGIATEVNREEAMEPYQSILTLTLLMLGAIGVSLAVLAGLLVNRGRILARQYAFEQAAEARTQTLAMVSHDLRSPLNNVVLCAGMISERADRNTLHHVQSVIERSGQRMRRLIADLLDVAELEGGRLKMARKPTDVRTLIEDVRNAMAGEASARHVELDVNLPRNLPPIYADPDRMTQVLANLVENALKFTPGGGRVFLNALASADHVLFEVTDTGPGIPEDRLPHIFEEFWTTASSGRSGRGLGLYIAKALVDYHGGRIWVQTGSQGTSFFFTIPTSAHAITG